ncbi:Casein kinase substrate, phosphoprotein PP28 [Niveomyces insectorum RCEF 264]|uniref:Casein kinase substrate, phosphoprotein PP28 n=1 Tax=Niveomyces insectorum RCEF 264 TaxID=1081102 RepID=A0A167SQI5_9HYPO|nr:Casein kinase substrate, phosphoprotein PP28 [Niveomyces insectorum RCEF 264]
MVGGVAPGANSRGRGGKFRKFTRGGGKHFSRDLRPLDADGNEISMWSEDAQNKLGNTQDSEEDSEEESEEESESDGGGPSSGRGKGGASAAAIAAASREDRRKEKKARKEAAIARAKGQAVQVGDLPSSDEEEDDSDDDDEDDLPSNPNHSRAGRNQTKAAARPAADANAVANGVRDLSLGANGGGAGGGGGANGAGAAAAAGGGTPSRRERESYEAQQAKERYRKLHEQGKTDEAKADLARLKIIREKREAEAARKQAEKEAKDAEEKARKQEIEAKEAKLREAAMGKPKVKGKK